MTAKNQKCRALAWSLATGFLFFAFAPIVARAEISGPYWAWTVTAQSGSTWMNPGGALHNPNGCNASDAATKLHSTNSSVNAQKLTASNFELNNPPTPGQPFSMPPGHSITAVYVDVHCRYKMDENCTTNSVRLTFGGSASGIEDSPNWTQNNTNCAWRMGGTYGRNIFGHHPSPWTAADINNLTIAVNIKNSCSTTNNLLMVDAFRVYVEHSCIEDSDADGVVNCNDGCPFDPGKTTPGLCGCGVSDSNYGTWYLDQDSDGYGDPGISIQFCSPPGYVTNNLDNCPTDPAKTSPGACGCGLPDVLYVNASATGVNNGLSWGHAFLDLRSALSIATSGCQIWVASGTYMPDGGRIPIGGLRIAGSGVTSASFSVPSNVTLFGGFAGGESSPSQRLATTSPTILSGDLLDNDALDIRDPFSRTDNSRVIVSQAANLTGAAIDGITIADGNCFVWPGCGGGVVNHGDLQMHNCILKRNRYIRGSAIKSYGTLTLTNCLIENNLCSAHSTLPSSLWPPPTTWPPPDESEVPSGSSVEVSGSLNMTLCQFSQNVTDSSDNGLSIWCEDSARVVIHQSDIGSISGDIGTDSILNPGADHEVRTNLVAHGATQILSGELIVPSNGVLYLKDSTAVDFGPLRENGLIVCNGLLNASGGAQIRNAGISIKRASISGSSLLNNNIIIAEAGVPAGQFYIENGVDVEDNYIYSDGDRFLDLDPSLFSGSIARNHLFVTISEGSGLSRGGLMESRGRDSECNANCPSGAYPLQTIPDFDTQSWTLDLLEILPGAKINLTNRFGFQTGISSGFDEVLYVKTLKMHPGAVLNTALQRMYYKNLVNENNVLMTVNESEPLAPLANGSRLEDVPLLGFSLSNVAMEDDTEFETRIISRKRALSDSPQPSSPPYKEGAITRIVFPVSGNANNGVMRMVTKAVGAIQASSVSAKATFAKANEESIEVKFSYKFCGQITDELIVYLGDKATPHDPDDPNPIGNHIEVARVYPPVSGRGAVGSNEFATFSGRFARGSLNFNRGTYVELELRGPNACVLIDDLDPVVCLWCACGDFSGEGVCGVEELDYLYLLSEYGNNVNDTNLCADQMGLDHYVDMTDLLNWSSAFHDPVALNLCDGIAGATGGSADQTNLISGLAIAGKPVSNGQNDAIYPVNTDTLFAGPAVPAAAQNSGTRSGNGVLVNDSSSFLYQLHGVLGLIRLADGQISLAPKSFSNVNLQHVEPGSTVHVGLNAGGGYALLDAAFDPTDPTNSTLFILPAQVDPPGMGGFGCPYRAVAKVHLTGGGDYELLSIHGANPATDSSIVSSTGDCDDFVYAPDASRIREVEVDEFGNLFVTSAQGVNDNNYVLVYPTGSEEEIRVSLSGQVQAPTALHVKGDFLYLSTSLDGSDINDSFVHRYSIARNGNSSTGLNTSPSGHAIFPIPGIRFLTAITTDLSVDKLFAVGFGSLSCTREACADDPTCPLGCVFTPGDPIFTTAMLAIITNSESAAPTIQVSAIAGSDLALPISVAIVGAACGTADIDGNGLTDTADIGPFIIALLDPISANLCSADLNGDQAVNGSDIQNFVNLLIN